MKAVHKSSVHGFAEHGQISGEIFLVLVPSNSQVSSNACTELLCIADSILFFIRKGKCHLLLPNCFQYLFSHSIYVFTSFYDIFLYLSNFFFSELFLWSCLL